MTTKNRLTEIYFTLFLIGVENNIDVSRWYTTINGRSVMSGDSELQATRVMLFPSINQDVINLKQEYNRLFL
jgi:hypothetical protein